MKRILLPLVLLTVSAIAAAQPKPHIVDKAHSQINFVAEARLLTAHGFFDKWEADIQLDATKIENSTFKITIDAASINTRNERRDNHLRSNDFFGVAQFPQIVLVSKKITKTADKKYTITGDLTLRGVTKQIEVPLTQVFYDDNRGRFRARFEINRKEYGINYNSKLNPIEDVVEVQVDINVQDKEAVEKAAAQRQQRPN
jgi:polyisoprenoid-binding protein YceI